ncbi:hypothetical protein Tco_1070485 [Tanacetum coccineum]|uniref:Uncharacterized protein n=1 Tax=Tanacetum coccineum TaxID=301880 RepID=A0ABQ5HLN5_9ASTR
MAERGRTVVTARKIKTGYGFPKKPPSRLGNDRVVWTAYFVSLQWKDFQDSPDDEEDTRSSQEYLNYLEEEYQERALLAKSTRFLKKGSIDFSSAKAIDDTICHKCAYEWDEEDLSSDVNEMTEVKVLMALADYESVVMGKESTRNGEWVNISMKKAESQVQITNPLVAITDSSATKYDLVDESLVCSTPLPPLEKLAGAEPVSGPKTIESILILKFSFTAETLKGVTINDPSSSFLVTFRKIPSSTGSGMLKDIWTRGLKIFCTNMWNNQDLKWCVEMTQHASLKDMVLLNVMFDEKRGTIFNSNKEIVMIAPRVRDVYVLNMTYFAQESFFFAKYQVNSNVVSFIDPHERPKPVVIETNFSYDQNDYLAQDDEIFNEDHFEHSNHNNDNHIIDNLPSTKDVQTSKPVSSPAVIKQSERGISINQEKYVKSAESMTSFSSSVKAPMVPSNNLGPDLNGKADKTRYRGYSDSDYAGYNIDKKSTSSACQLLGGKIVCWSAKKQDHILKGDIELHFIPTQYQLADIFTKPLDEPTFKRLICKLGMLNIDGSKHEPLNDSSDED